MKNFLFSNIGGKIKMLAFLLFLLVAVLAMAVALFDVVTDFVSASKNDTAVSALVEIGKILSGVAVVVGAWIGNFFLYAFGQLVENSDHIETILRVMSIGNPNFERFK